MINELTFNALHYDQCANSIWSMAYITFSLFLQNHSIFVNMKVTLWNAQEVKSILRVPCTVVQMEGTAIERDLRYAPVHIKGYFISSCALLLRLKKERLWLMGQYIIPWINIFVRNDSWGKWEYYNVVPFEMDCPRIHTVTISPLWIEMFRVY